MGRAGQPYAVAPARARRLAARVVAATGARVTTTAPYTGGPLADLPVSTEDDVAAAFAAARRAQPAWAATDVGQRAAVLLRLHDSVLDRRDEALDLVQWESGKARRHALEEVLDVATVARHYGRRARSYLAPQRLPGAMPVVASARLLRHPKGVVGLVSPWNYPLSMAITDLLPAVVAGNAVVLKPDTQAALSTLWGVERLVEAGLPAGVVQVVLGEGPVIGPAVTDRADYVCFTGSTRTGRDVATRAAARLVGASLELGGKNAMLVLADADVRRAARGAVRACFTGAGQSCVSIERILVDDSVHDEFVGRFVAGVRAMRLGAGRSWHIDMGSLVSRRQLDTVTRHVDDARSKGATVLAGGRARPDLGPYFYEPTVLAGVTPEMAVSADETFGPVVSVYRVNGEDDAVRRANASAYGLNASVWTRSQARGQAVAARLHAGTVNVNGGRPVGRADGPGRRPAPRRRGHLEVHRVPDGRRTAGLDDRPSAGSAGGGVGRGVDDVDARVEGSREKLRAAGIERDEERTWRRRRGTAR
jgi:succinate-semialdehyde dehydrogenase/glutarate-semialdehyde dehydrogenase